MNKQRKLKYTINNPNPPDEFGFYLAKVFVEVHADKLKQAVIDKQKEIQKNEKEKHSA